MEGQGQPIVSPYPRPTRLSDADRLMLVRGAMDSLDVAALVGCLLHACGWLSIFADHINDYLSWPDRVATYHMVGALCLLVAMVGTLLTSLHVGCKLERALGLPCDTALKFTLKATLLAPLTFCLAGVFLLNKLLARELPRLDVEVRFGVSRIDIMRRVAELAQHENVGRVCADSPPKP